jgi:hypothetical protein
MKAPGTPYILLLLALLGSFAVMSAGRAEAFLFGYRANHPVRADWCYRGPAWDYLAAYYNSRRHYRGRCYRYCCRR